MNTPVTLTPATRLRFVDCDKFITKYNFFALPVHLSHSRDTYLLMPNEIQGDLKRLAEQYEWNNVRLAQVISSIKNNVFFEGRKYSKSFSLLMRSCLAVAENVYTSSPPKNKPHPWSFYSVLEATTDAMFGYKKYLDDKGETFRPDTETSLNSVRGLVLFLYANSTNNHGKNVCDSMVAWEDYEVDCTTIVNDDVAQFVIDHPEQGEDVGEFLQERSLGNSDEEARFAINHVTETRLVPALSRGAL